jgi:hypothetical protein
MLIDKVLMEIMVELGLAIDNNIKQKDKVIQTENQKAIDVWTGQEQGLKYAMVIVSEIRNKYLNESKIKPKK